MPIAQLARNSIGAEIKRWWFDSQAVLDATDAAARKVHSRYGYFVMRDARQSIRKRKRPSNPDQPPTNQTSLLKRFIFFAWEPENQGAIAGPARLAGSRGSKFIPETLEKGGGRIAPRPYMKPAHDRQAPKALELWRDAAK